MDHHETLRLLHDYNELRWSAAQKRLDIRISYPDRVLPHEPMEEIEREARSRVRGHEKEVNRDEQVKRIADFFGMRDHFLVLPSAGAGLETVLQYFTKTDDNVYLPEPAYLFDNFVMSLANGKRNVSRIEKQELENLSRSGSKSNTFIVETPRRSDFLEHDDIVYRMLAGETNRDSLVIYDAVNSFYGVDTVVEKGTDGNRLVRKSYPVADKAIRIEGTSKVFPEGFHNLAIVEISDALYAEDPERYKRYKEAITRMGYNTPTNTDLYVMAEILHSKKFPVFLGYLKALARENSRYVQKAFENKSVLWDGINVFIEIGTDNCGVSPKSIVDDFKNFGINVLHSNQFYNQGSPDGKNYIRLPIIKDKSDLETVVDKLREILEIRERAKQILYTICEAQRAMSEALKS